MTEPIMVKPNSSRVAGPLSSQGRSTGVVGSLYLVPPLYGQQTLSSLYGGPTNWTITAFQTWYEGLAGWSTPGVQDLNGFTYSGGRLTAMARGRYRYHLHLTFNTSGSKHAIMSGLSVNSADPIAMTHAREQVAISTYKADNMDSAAHVDLEAGDTVAISVNNTWGNNNIAVYEATLRIESVNL